MAVPTSITELNASSLGKFKVDLSKPFRRPQREILQAKHVELRPWEDSFAETLFPHVGGTENAHLFDYLAIGPFDDLETFRTVVKNVSSDKLVLWGIFKSGTRDECVGLANLHTTDEENRNIELGLLLSRAVQKTPVGTETFYLIARKAFDLNCRRLEWRCDIANAASRRAALRYGFGEAQRIGILEDCKISLLFADITEELEGTLRHHMIIRGYNRDSASFSMLDVEWPGRRHALEQWMSGDNFDENGWQKQDLAAFMKASTAAS